jgi:hypothetical protein
MRAEISRGFLEADAGRLLKRAAELYAATLPPAQPRDAGHPPPLAPSFGVVDEALLARARAPYAVQDSK